MDLFTYLMAKNGNNSSVHGDLFSYLLGKGQSQTQTISGVTIYIPDAKKLVSFMMTKESSQETTIGKNLVNPYLVSQTIKGVSVNYDAITQEITLNGTYTDSTLSSLELPNNSSINIPANTKAYMQIKYISGSTSGGYFAFQCYTSNYDYNIMTDGTNMTSDVKTDKTRTIDAVIALFRLRFGENIVFNNFKIKVYFSLVDNNYEPYTNGPSPNPDYPQEVKTVKGSVDVYVSNGETTNTYTINLGNNEIVGIGDYKDELLVDKSGNVSIEKNTAKIDSYNGETITTPYMSTTGGLDIGATVYYGIDTPVTIDLQTTVDLSLFKGANTITNSEDGYMTIKYK